MDLPRFGTKNPKINFKLFKEGGGLSAHCVAPLQECTQLRQNIKQDNVFYYILQAEI